MEVGKLAGWCEPENTRSGSQPFRPASDPFNAHLVRCDRNTLVLSLTGTYTKREDAIQDAAWFTEHDASGLYLVL